jgi:hypothetical protein
VPLNRMRDLSSYKETDVTRVPPIDPREPYYFDTPDAQKYRGEVLLQFTREGKRYRAFLIDTRLARKLECRSKTTCVRPPHDSSSPTSHLTARGGEWRLRSPRLS